MSAAGTVIVGNGHAGFQVAVSLRKLGYEGPVTLVGEEDGLPYQRPPLSKDWLHGSMGSEDLPFRPASFFAKKDIDLIAGDRVVAIDRSRQTVELESGTELDYQSLVLATGARCRPLEIEGIDLDGVVELRTWAHAEDLAARLEDARRVVVVGGGFIGLEAAAAARRRGAEVTVVEAFDRVMSRVVSPAISTYMTQLHEDQGTTVLVDTEVESLAAGSSGTSVASVHLADGTDIEADIVVVGVGVIPNDELAAAADLEVADGVVVDASLRTSDERVWAIGDCAAFPLPDGGERVRLESVQNATDHARHVAAAIAASEGSAGGEGSDDSADGEDGAGEEGEGAEDPGGYDKVAWFWSTQHDCKLQIAGLTDGHDRTVVRGDPESGKFSVFCFAGDRLLGVESINGSRDHLAARKLLNAGVACADDQVADLDFDLRSLVAKAEG